MDNGTISARVMPGRRGRPARRGAEVSPACLLVLTGAGGADVGAGPGRVDRRQIDAGVPARLVQTGLVMARQRRTAVRVLSRRAAQAGEGARRVRLVPRPQPAARRRRDAQASGGAVDITPAAEKAPSGANCAAPA